MYDASRCTASFYRAHGFQLRASSDDTVSTGITGRIPLNRSVEGDFNHSCYIQDHECITESEIEKYVVYPLVLQIGASVYVPDRR